VSFLTRVFAALALLCLLSSTAPLQASARVTLAAEPDWVAPHAPVLDAAVEADRSNGGTRWLLVDHQTRIGDDQRSDYRHLVGEALNEDGVDNLANLSFEVDPSYQRFALHRLQVLRGGRVISQDGRAEVQVLQRETELEARILDGRQTINVLLHDVRVGDVVEYAYSLSGAHPAFHGIEFDSHSLQWSEPLAQLRLRLLAPLSRPLQPRSIGSTLEPVVVERNGWREWRWAQDGIGRLQREDATPSWFDPWPSIAWSEFADWNAVARWAAPLYAPAPETGELAAVLAELRAAGDTPEQRLLAALRWVQGEVRYLGIEVGAGAFVPRQPALVLQRRFGDCKDKTLLLLSLLAALDIEAAAALVHTDRVVDAEALPPTPARFNHVIVRARLDGRDYWLDPTRARQTAGLDALVQPDLGLALVVDPATRGLTAMPAAQPERRDITVSIDAREGMAAPATMRVHTVFHGPGAERVRAQFASDGEAAMQEAYRDYYGNYYDGLESVGALTVTDHAPANRIEVVEQYTIGEFWAREEEDSGPWLAYVQVPDMLDALQAPEAEGRTMPLAVEHPLEVTVRTEVRLHEPWPFEAYTVEIADPHFRFDQRLEGDENHFIFIDAYRSLADHVPAEAAAAYAERMQEARDEVGYQFSYDPGAAGLGDALDAAARASGINWLLVLFATLLLSLGAGFAVLVNLWDPPPRPSTRQPPLCGLGGWLILPGLDLLLAPLAGMLMLYTLLPELGSERWAVLTDPGSDAFHVGWAPLLLWELSTLCLTLVVDVLVLLQFFARRSSVPRLYTLRLLFYVASMAATWAVVAAAAVPGREAGVAEPVALGIALLSLIIWGSYFHRSERVKATFVRRRHPDHRPVPLATSLPQAA
jgi:hypothetical protein